MSKIFLQSIEVLAQFVLRHIAGGLLEDGHHRSSLELFVVRDKERLLLFAPLSSKDYVAAALAFNRKSELREYLDDFLPRETLRLRRARAPGARSSRAPRG